MPITTSHVIVLNQTLLRLTQKAQTFGYFNDASQQLTEAQNTLKGLSVAFERELILTEIKKFYAAIHTLYQALRKYPQQDMTVIQLRLVLDHASLERETYSEDIQRQLPLKLLDTIKSRLSDTPFIDPTGLHYLLDIALHKTAQLYQHTSTFIRRHSRVCKAAFFMVATLPLTIESAPYFMKTASAACFFSYTLYNTGKEGYRAARKYIGKTFGK